MRFIEIVEKHIRKYDNITLVVYGRVGSGKSVAAYQIGKRIAKMICGGFYYSFLVDDVLRRVFEQDNQIIVFDEVAYWLSSYADRQNAEKVRKILQTTRVKRISFVLVSPFGIEMSKMVRRYADYVLVMKKRGVAVVYRVEREFLRGRVWAVRFGLLKIPYMLTDEEKAEMDEKKTQFLKRVEEQTNDERGGAFLITT